jgi:hypothetical protein
MAGRQGRVIIRPHRWKGENHEKDEHRHSGKEQDQSSACREAAEGTAAGERVVAGAVPGDALEAGLCRPVRGAMPVVRVCLSAAEVAAIDGQVASAGPNAAMHEPSRRSGRAARGSADRHVP